jgi:hypothetical protein
MEHNIEIQSYGHFHLLKYSTRDTRKDQWQPIGERVLDVKGVERVIAAAGARGHLQEVADLRRIKAAETPPAGTKPAQELHPEATAPSPAAAPKRETA